MTINANSSRLFRQGTATGLVLLLTVIGLTPVAEAATWWIKRDWSKVQRIESGTRTRVRLYKDRAPGGIQRVEGQFQSASTEAIILLSPDGQTVILQKQAVKKVLVYRPIRKRYQGWITLGVFAALSVPVVPRSDIVPSGRLFLNSLFIGLPTGIAFLAAPRWGGIYIVPRKLRDDPPSTDPPTATPKSSTTSGSRLLLLEDRSFGAERLRSQSRSLLLREKLLLDLSSRPMRPRRTGSD